jgi:peptidoglycan/xylan/chitin deacetylase (PgdA/CDA1 family)
MLLPLLGAGAVAAAGAAAYQAMAPTAQCFGRTFTGLPSGSKQLALTYDDGPNDPHTLRLLEVLSRHGARATFFLIGRFVERRPDIAREIVEQGHAVGNHTWSHPRLIFRGNAQTRWQLERCQQAIESATGVASRLFRPPFGGRRPATLRIARSLGLEPIMWNIAGRDWRASLAARIANRVSRRIRGGDVILLHDGGHRVMGADRGQTVIATEALLARWQAAGYEFVSVPEMMKMVSSQPSAVASE